jgi:hypothetical protein
MLKKLFIIPWFGPYPPWLDQWVANMELLKEWGYDYKIYSNIELFRERVKESLGIIPNIEKGTGKAWDYRPALATLFSRDVKGYDYWGHTDFDCVYGDVGKFLPDTELVKWDVWTNHDAYICGAWTLYKNDRFINEAYKLNVSWRKEMENPNPTGWVETGYTNTINKVLKISYNLEQPKNWNDFSALRLNEGSLYEGETEVMMAHFRRTKTWPAHIQI